MNKEDLKSEFKKVYYKDQAGENEILDNRELGILDVVLRPVYELKNFNESKLSDLEQYFPAVGMEYRKLLGEG